jgi:hypothetical protein
MKKIQMHIEVDGDQAWVFKDRACPCIPEAPLHGMLRWVLEQLHTGSCELETEEAGEVVTLIFGKAAAQTFEAPVREKAEEHFGRRYAALNIAGLFAHAREAGVEPKHADIVKQAHGMATPHSAARMNTDFHYAFELTRILERIHEKTFVFTSPPIKGRVGDDVSRMVGEATRAYLFGLNRACISLCRALMEGALKERVRWEAVRDEQYQSPNEKGYLEALIDAAAKESVLNEAMKKVAHSIRRAGNAALHGPEPSDKFSWEILQGARALVEHVCARGTRR